MTSYRRGQSRVGRSVPTHLISDFELSAMRAASTIV